jgi:hypothetical protein
MRTTSGAVLSENSLKFKELDEKKRLHGWRIQVECAGLTRWWFDLVGCFGRVDRKRLKEVVDSGFERCRMRLPLTRRGSDLKRKRLRRNEKFFKNSLTD